MHPDQDLAKTELIVGAMRRHLAASRDLEHSLKNTAGLRSLDDFSANIYVIVHTNSSATREFGERPHWVFGFRDQLGVRGPLSPTTARPSITRLAVFLCVGLPHHTL